MFETKEQYDAALAGLQTPEEQEAFMAQNGDGSDLPTEAAKAVTRVETPEEAAQPFEPVSPNSTLGFETPDAEPASEEEIEQ